MTGPDQKDFYTVSEQLEPAIYESFKQALQTGKWPDGRTLTQEQRSLVMESVIVYEAANVAPEQRLGQVEGGCPGDAGSAAGDTQTIKAPQ